MKIVVVRHGDVPSHNKGKACDDNEVLTERGIEQAKELRKKLGKYRFDAIYCSALQRTKEMAQIITEGQDIEITIDERLNTRRKQKGMSLNLLADKAYWDLHYHDYDGKIEPLSEFYNRVCQFLGEITTKSYDTVLIVTHSSVIKAIEAYFMNKMEDGYILSDGLKPGSIAIYER